MQNVGGRIRRAVCTCRVFLVPNGILYGMVYAYLVFNTTTWYGGGGGGDVVIAV